MDVAVIGAGISGLSRAYRLVQQGHAVTLFEPGAVGGVIRTLKRDGFTLEQGPNVLVEKPELGQLFDELNLRADVIYPNVARYRQMVWWDGAAHRVPKSPLAFFRSPLIERSAKWGFPFKLFRSGALRVPAADADMADCSVGEFVQQLIGQDGVKRLLDPALKGIFGGDPYRLSARSIFPELYRIIEDGGSVFQFMKGRAARKICVLRGGLRVLPERIMERIADKVRFEPRLVDAVERQGVRFAVECGGMRQSFDQVHVATSGAATASFLRLLDSEVSEALRQIRYASLAFVHLAVSRSAPIPPHHFGILFNGERPSGLLGVMFNSELFPHVAPDRYQLVTICVGGVGREPIVDRPDGEHLRWLTTELKELLGIDRPALLAVQRWPRAIPQLGVGHYRLVRQLQAVESANPGLFLIGVDRGGVGVPDRVSMGLACGA